MKTPQPSRRIKTVLVQIVLNEDCFPPWRHSRLRISSRVYKRLETVILTVKLFKFSAQVNPKLRHQFLYVFSENIDFEFLEILNNRSKQKNTAHCSYHTSTLWT